MADDAFTALKGSKTASLGMTQTFVPFAQVKGTLWITVKT